MQSFGQKYLGFAKKTGFIELSDKSVNKLLEQRTGEKAADKNE